MKTVEIWVVIVFNLFVLLVLSTGILYSLYLIIQENIILGLSLFLISMKGIQWVRHNNAEEAD